MTEKETNTFQEMEGKKTSTPEQTKTAQAPKEVSTEDFSDAAIGDKKKYVRPNLNGKEDVIEMFQVFSPDLNEEPKSAQTGTSKYWPVTMIMTLGSKNEDEMENREYISGARIFQNKTGGASDINFWYKGSENQSSYMWELVDESLEIKPTELSPRQFIAYLNSKPKVKMILRQEKNYNAPIGASKFVQKNMPGEFVKA